MHKKTLSSSHTKSTDSFNYPSLLAITLGRCLILYPGSAQS